MLDTSVNIQQKVINYAYVKRSGSMLCIFSEVNT
jgi:hypothetical protein